MFISVPFMMLEYFWHNLFCSCKMIVYVFPKFYIFFIVIAFVVIVAIFHESSKFILCPVGLA